MSAGSAKDTLVRPWFDSYVGGLFLFSSLLSKLFLLCVFSYCYSYFSQHLKPLFDLQRFDIN